MLDLLSLELVAAVEQQQLVEMAVLLGEVVNQVLRDL